MITERNFHKKVHEEPNPSASRWRGAIPPYLLERLASAASSPQPGARASSSGLETIAELARRTLLTDSRLRHRRTAENGSDSAARTASRLHREISDAEGTEALPGRLVR